MTSPSFVSGRVYQPSIFVLGLCLVQLSLIELVHAVTFAPTGASYPGFTCKYPSLTGWEACNGPASRDCWLRKRQNGSRYQGQDVFDIHTDYEDITPPGVTREYWLSVSEMPMTPDGYVKKLAKVFNESYPGPLIEACWGDQIIVHIHNDLPDNGTTVHWHGLRQLGSNEFDGVNGVTQCPIALGDDFTYNFTARQYGHSWYHSHYALQYGDGAAGPLLIHGPNSADWDEAWTPVIMSDWVHPSAFSYMHEVLTSLPPSQDSILLNGTGHYACDPSTDELCVGGGGYLEKVFERGKRYLLRLINGSIDTAFTFSIDGHSLRVISTDFVPIVPYDANSIVIGIGQRYSIVVDANALDVFSSDFWIRTEPALGCGTFARPEAISTTTGIIRYDASSNALPPSLPHFNIDECRDERMESLKPILPWQVGNVPSNDVAEDTFKAAIDLQENHGSRLRWEMAEYPLWLNFSDPTILNLDQSTFNPEYDVIPYDYNHGWVYLIITASLFPIQLPNVNIPIAHPIHLHGHDFAVIGQGNGYYDPVTTPATFNFDNPPRRDTALLPANGYLAIAFKPDNPGVWLVHCHIAWHASSGLALQIMERQGEIEGVIGPLDATQRGCKNWDEWSLQYVRDDSGI